MNTDEEEPEVEPSVEVTEDLFTKVDQDGVQIWPESDEYKELQKRNWV